MKFALILTVTALACFALRHQIKRHPVVFYALAVAVDLAFVASCCFEVPRAMWGLLFLLVQKCTVALALFVVVMYIGVFDKNSRISHALRPIRAELSIIAWLLSLGHMAVYLESYVPRIMGAGSFGGNVLVSFCVAVVLLILLMVLGITSFQFVKKRMGSDAWRRIQKLSYPFFMFVYVHLMLMLLPSALAGGAASQIAVGVYSVVFLGYAALRLARACRDRASRGDAAGQ